MSLEISLVYLMKKFFIVNEVYVQDTKMPKWKQWNIRWMYFTELQS